MNRRNLALVIGIVLLLGVAIWLGMKLASSEDKMSPYSAVYLDTGDIYFGKYSKFPSPKMTNVWYLERGEEQIGLVPFKNVFWGPGEELSINEDKIVLVAGIKADSQLAKTMSGEMTPPSGTATQGNTPAPVAPAGSAGIEPTSLEE